MQQLTQQLKSGKMEILEVPFPKLGKNQVLVQNYYSVISAGTEGKTVTDARKGYIAKAKSRQKEVKQVIDLIKTQGLKDTYDMVMNKLEAPAPLGYSCAGEVIAVGESVTSFKVGDKVSCGGATASHAEVVSVPVNLCVKIPDTVELKQAAFATIAAIAIQGIRQANLKMGENCVIIGLGLIGQLTALILQASGIKAIGTDVSAEQVKAAKSAGVQYVVERNIEGIEALITGYTHGLGADAVIITAGTSSLDPVEFAGSVARQKGKVVVVGAVPTGFSRSNYYKKELELLMSCSYGPGRYDANYEEKGIDYPPAYVRFTENRNMASFIELLASSKLDITSLITHTFDLTESPEAYQLILRRSEPFTGILIQYNQQEMKDQDIPIHSYINTRSIVNAGFIGAGSFAQNMLLPNLKDKCNFTGIVTGKGNNSVYVGRKYHFATATSDENKIFDDPGTNTVFIVTRHDSHAQLVLKALKAQKHVFVEKPLALKEPELEEIDAYYRANGQSMLMVGYNRRFSPAIREVQSVFNKNQAKSIQMRINAGVLPKGHWVNDPEIGGGRIIGEACHFIDLAIYLAGSEVKSVYATAFEDASGLDNTIAINLTFRNGSIASISYFSNGSKKLAKEKIEIFCGESVAVIDDFNKLSLYGKHVKTYKYKGQSKGHQQELEAFTEAIRTGQPCPIPYPEIYLSSKVTFDAIRSIREKRPVFYS